MFSSYKTDDVEILLKDISGKVEFLSTPEREKNIQNGLHYSEMLPIEYKPTKEYMKIYEMALDKFADKTAMAVASVSAQIWDDKGENTVLVSLARAGTSIGVLIKRYIEKYYKCRIKHYTISIIRDKGIDRNAIEYILKRHRPESIQFVDGWTGKGTIKRELEKAMLDYPMINPGLAVLSDPANIAEKCGTHDDFLIASSCLNATVSGLLSRTFLRSDIIGKDDFHGSVFYKELIGDDLTYQFIDTIEKRFKNNPQKIDLKVNTDETGLSEVKRIAGEFGIKDINLVKPGIGETTRVLLRRLPWKILVHSLDDIDNLGHIYQLAKEKNVDVVEYPLHNYLSCGLIRNISDM